MSLEESEDVVLIPCSLIPMNQKGYTAIWKISGRALWDNRVPEVDYEAVPVEAQGLAMLQCRGGNWRGYWLYFQSSDEALCKLMEAQVGLVASPTEPHALASNGSSGSSTHKAR